MKKVITLLALFCIAAFAQNTFTDPRDGKKYKTAKIGNQTWIAQNLDYHGEDGYLGLCYGDEPQKKIRKPENCKKYGRLYDWNEATKACPKGWHLPSNKEWEILMDFAGGKEEIPGNKLKAKNGWPEHDFLESYKSLKELEQGLEADLSKKNISYKRNSKSPKCKWTEEEIDNRGRIKVTEHDHCITDEYGFSALPGGSFFSNDGFFAAGKLGYWWSADNEHYRMSYSHSSYGHDGGCDDNSDSPLFSVRCLQGPSEQGSSEHGSCKRNIDIVIDTSRSNADIMAVVNARLPSLKNIYNRFLKQKPGFSGKVTLRFTISAGGDIISINIVSSTTGFPEFDSTIKDVVSKWKWKVIKSGNTTITVPINFTE
jgi:TonB family protein